jgi:outer membrane protein assembly factor BamD (BamD/ComL family)
VQLLSFIYEPLKRISQALSQSSGHRATSVVAKFLISLLLLCFFSSCIPKLPEDFTSEESLYDYTTQLLKEDKQDEALKFLSAFRNRYPLSQRTPEVELAIGDLHVVEAEP